MKHQRLYRGGQGDQSLEKGQGGRWGLSRDTDGGEWRLREVPGFRDATGNASERGFMGEGGGTQKMGIEIWQKLRNSVKSDSAEAERGPGEGRSQILENLGMIDLALVWKGWDQ